MLRTVLYHLQKVSAQNFAHLIRHLAVRVLLSFVTLFFSEFFVMLGGELRALHCSFTELLLSASGSL